MTMVKAKDLFLQLEKRGYKGRIVSIRRLPDLQKEIEGLYKQGLLDEGFYQERLAWFTFSPPDSLPEPRSIIVIAIPQPQIQVIFSWNEGALALLVPPTYVAYREVNQRVEDLLAAFLRPERYQVTQAALPLKPLAVRSGLGCYGRNNICYVHGMGSFHRLVAFYSDFPCQEDEWREPEMLERCQNCQACLRSCPTGAIAPERFLLHAERCITFHNERSDDFPSWIDPSWHNCLIGCLHCQRVCPQNRDFLNWVERGEEFSREETALILARVPLDQFPSATAEKLERLDLVEYMDVLPRNLRVMLTRMSQQRG
ncbi:MAG: epoxyqueuosine reductase [Chloroflexi bacterium]|nr:epoxyqueuosine reductase [Chloroflexota bacterium]